LFVRKDGRVATLIIEIHVPFHPAPVVPEGEYPFPWIDVIEDFLHGLEEEGGIEVFDDGEEYGDAYVFFITGSNEGDLLAFPQACTPWSLTTKQGSSGSAVEWTCR
jgi:hypothetical protein